jgi:hypothetical protein
MPYTASIIERQFIYIPDKILCLGGAAWLRQLPVLTLPWSRIRIGLICAVTPDGVNNIQDTSFTLGLCSGQQYPGSSFTTLNYLGASLIGTQAVAATRLLTYNASGPYYGCTAGYFFCKTEGTINSTSTTFATAVNLSPAYTGRYKRRTLLVLDITKSQGESGAVTMTLYGPSTTLVQTTDYRPDDLQDALDCLTTPTIRDQAMTQLHSVATVMYSPMLGAVDTLEIFWGNTAFPLEISAIGAFVTAPPYYSGTSLLGTAIDRFDEYGTTYGSISETSFLSGGSGWAADGSVVYDVTIGASANTSNLAPQVYTQYVGTTNTPDDPFEQYLVGTVNSGTSPVNMGTWWGGAGSVLAVADLYAAQIYTEYVGTTSAPDDPFEQYALGTVTSSTITLGTWWGGTGISIIQAAPVIAPQSYTAFAGTTYNPNDDFESYVVNNGSTTYGTTSSFSGMMPYWGSNTGTIYSGGSFADIGTTSFNPFPMVFATYNYPTDGNALYGTTVGLPYDTFESYGTGSITSGVTVNGSYWGANANVYTYLVY